MVMLKKIFSLCLMLVTSYVSADNWAENWALATECSENMQFDEALKYLNLAIEDPDVNPVVYIQRADLLVFKKDYLQAQKDIDFALASEKLSEFDKPEAHHVKGHVCLFLNQHDVGFTHFQIWKNTSKAFPEIIETETIAIVRNIVANDLTRKIYADVYRVFGECESIDDVSIVDPTTLMVKKKITEKLQDCGCGCGGENELKDDLHTKEFGFFSDCHWSCEMATYFGEGTCALFPKMLCRIACISLVKKWDIKCHDCCTSGNFYEYCVAPYKNLISDVVCQGCEYAGQAAALGWGFNELSVKSN